MQEAACYFCQNIRNQRIVQIKIFISWCAQLQFITNHYEKTNMYIECSSVVTISEILRTLMDGTKDLKLMKYPVNILSSKFIKNYNNTHCSKVAIIVVECIMSIRVYLLLLAFLKLPKSWRKTM